MQVKISYNLKSVVLVNGKENLILEQKENVNESGKKEKFIVQMKLEALQEKKVRFILTDKVDQNSFYFIICG